MCSLLNCWLSDCELSTDRLVGVTIPSVWPRGPFVLQVTSALIWLISLTSLFLGGPTYKCDLSRQEPDGFTLQVQETQISWQLLTYIELKPAHSFIYPVTRANRANVITRLLLCRMSAVVNIIHLTLSCLNTEIITQCRLVTEWCTLGRTLKSSVETFYFLNLKENILFLGCIQNGMKKGKEGSFLYYQNYITKCSKMTKTNLVWCPTKFLFWSVLHVILEEHRV